MIRNYLMVALRSLKKSPTYSFINVVGLSIGICCSLLILLWIADELSFDRFLPKADRLYVVEANVTYDGRINTWNAAPLAAYESLKSEDANIKNTAVADHGNNHLLAVGEKRIRKEGCFVSEEFLTMFEFPLLKGQAKSVLSEPGNIVISESVAKALFGEQDPINQLILIDNTHQQKITGVIKDLPENSSFHFDCLLPWKLKESIDPNVMKNKTSWENYGYAVYVELGNSKNFNNTEDAIRELPERKTLSKNKSAAQIEHEFFLFPLTKWRLYSNFENGKSVGGGIEYVRLFAIVAGFILLMACINFMNLATARSEHRAKEVGIRKSVGSGRGQLISQFISESLMISFISMVIAILLAQLLLPAYNSLVQKQLYIPFDSLLFWVFVSGLILLTGIISGSYPAFYLSSFKPIQVLKGKIHVGKGGAAPRKILVTMQFCFSILLIIGMIVIYQQLQFVKNRDMGYDRENLISVKSTDEINKNYRVIKQDLLTSGAVVAVTKSNSAITSLNNWGFLGWPGKSTDDRVLFSNLATEYDYTKTMGIKILAGRDFSQEFKSDTGSLLINKAALDMMGLKDPIGQTLTFPNGTKRQLIGVLDNTVMASPTEAVFPMYVEFAPDWTGAITIRLNKTNDLPATLKSIEDVFRKYSPAYPFEYSFVDVDFQKKFSDINLMGKLANLFAVLAMVITGLGLFGLASFTAEQRTKEIGIRKVLGASVSSLIRLISKDFSKLVMLAFLISAPLGWWMLNKFLERYVYRISIPWWIIPATGLVALIFTMLAVSTQALRAATANPVKSLRNNE